MGLMEKFRTQPLIVQALDIIFVVSLIYEIVTWNRVNISLWILGLTIIVSLYMKYVKKEE